MEDVSYFLVAKIEGSIASAKKILSVYPCTQPSDTVSFRTSLTKYVEGLKNAALRGADAMVGIVLPASWWKEVIVRKSLFEECSGERFERLLLSLSTEAILRCSPRPYLSKSLQPLSDADLSHLYFESLAKSQIAQSQWEHVAARYEKRSENIRSLRYLIANPHRNHQSRYKHISTDRLLAQQKSRIDDLASSFWAEEDGWKALTTLAKFAGLNIEPCQSDAPLSALGDDRDIFEKKVDPQPEEPLPVAAAHHPSRILKLKKFKISSAGLSPSGNAAGENSEECLENHYYSRNLVVAEVQETEINLQHSLRDSLSQSMLEEEKLREQLRSLRSSLRPKKSSHRSLHLHLRTYETGSSIDFKSLPSRIDMSSFGLEGPTDHESTLHERVSKLRTSQLPQWPRVPEPAPKHLFEPSKLPQPAGRTKPNPLYAQNRQTEPKIPRKSSISTKARARRSSVFARRKTLNFDDEVERIIETVLDGYESPEGGDITRTPEHKITRGAQLTPRSTIKRGAPQPTFDMESRERAFTTQLPRLSEDIQLDLGDMDDDEVDGGDKYQHEGHSLTLKEMLLSTDVSYVGILEDPEGEVFDEDGDWE
ncbi:hypothetical protein NLI96_g8031 [Meripilus lineatus]|uniref:HAUS augmin-like complex subunit 6 N-terminal domain-containing protein n=1 Tax=Meripilus lineatus TaxID=2056292 RepID=A0AAD5UY30_9APHY|nr:hypothetical protein NLI96_g8031 [Physisporinus lineatus]